MTATLIALISMTVLGIPVTLAIDRNARGPLLLGAAFLYGSGAIFLVMLALSVVQLRWSLVNVTGLALVIFCAAAILATRQAPAAKEARGAIQAHVADLGTLLLLAAYALYATLASLWEWDFWAIWGLKGKVFLEVRGIDWRFLESGWNTFAHPDYPVLIPLNFDFVALVSGGWSDRWLGLLFVAWGAAMLLIVRALGSRETSPFFASLATLTLASLAGSRYLGFAEGGLIAFCGAGILLIRAALRDGDAASWRHGALMLGFGANCKNEGMAMLVAVTIAVAVSGSRALAISSREPRVTRAWVRATATLRHLWPAYALAAPWLLLRLMHTLPTDLAGGSPFSRLMARLPQTYEIVLFLATHLDQPWFWLAILIGILAVPARVRKGEFFVLLVTAIQLFFYIVVYFATPRDLHWHVLTSWSRVTGQIALPIAFAAFLMLAKSMQGSEDAPHAEARSDH